MKILDIEIFKTDTGYEIRSTGYHPSLPDSRVLPCDRVLDEPLAENSTLEQRVSQILRSQMLAQNILDTRGYDGYKNG